MIYADLTADERTRLRAAFAAGFATGTGSAWRLTDDAALASLMDAVVDDYLASLDLGAPALLSDDLSGHLLRMERQALETAPLRRTAPHCGES